eukprot:scaffold13427_cov78-Skeletonema_dohrnii-CCMP3373.AAC.1
MASIKCNCGKVELKFPTHAPRVSTECCCNNCRERLEFLARLGGPSVPDTPLFVASKWPNCIEIISGEDLLFAYKLNSTTQFCNMASSCCHTFLLGRHAEYDANCVTAQGEAAVYSDLAEGAIKPYARFFSNQWSPERIQKCKRKLIGIWVDESTGEIVGEEGYKDLFEAHIESISRPLPTDTVGLKFDDILEKLGRDNIIIVSGEKKS